MSHCQFYILRKNRFCRMSVKAGLKFCGEHLLQNGQNVIVNVINERVICPIDSSHTCYKSKLKKHLKVCNSRNQSSQADYIRVGINLGDNQQDLPVNLPLGEIDKQVIEKLLHQINASFDQLPKLEERILFHNVVKDELSNPTYGVDAKKHLTQAASLLGNLEQLGFIADNSCFIEFGAGRGNLTYWLGKALKNCVNTTILVVDRSSHRFKKDNKLKNEETNLKIRRLRCDIADLELRNVDNIVNAKNVVGIAKHLCGAATDFAVRCLENFCNQTDCKQTKVVALVLAFCCHHRCDYKHYVGKSYLESQGFTKDDFHILCKMASWATSGISLNEQQNGNIERELIGRKVKLLLNWGRLKFLENLGFECELCYYTSCDITLENVCIIARKKF